MFLRTPPTNEARATLYSRDVADDGYVANLTRLWAWRPDVLEAFGSLRKLLTEHAALSIRERSILVCATAANLGDSYCALAWGPRLATEATPDAAAAVLQRKDASELSARENALANWARQVVRAPNAIGNEDVDGLRSVGLTDGEIFDATAFIAFRMAFSTVNDALGAHPDRELAVAAPAVVRDAVTYGRRVSEDVPKHA